MSRPVIAFDLGSVLIEWNPDNLYKKLIPDDAERKRFFDEVCTFEWNAEQDRGRSYKEAIDVLVAKFPEKEALIRAYRERYTEMVGHPIKGTVAILKELKQQDYLVYAASNWPVETFELVRGRMTFLSEFDGIQVSGYIKLIKPDPAFYIKLGKTFGFDLKNCIFIDDREDNLASARPLGMQTILFKNPAQLAEDLRKLGVNVKTPTC